MSTIFNSVDKFFASLNKYIGLGENFVIFLGLFLVVAIVTFIATSHSYEAKLIKAIDMLNGYFVNNPKITADNLILFNQIMRHNKVPKLLRKHWQQFMLYREHNASYYMSFENCVEIPLRNSKFKRDRLIMNLFAYILAGSCLLLNAYFTAETADVAYALQKMLLTPIIILLLNYVLSIVLDLKESAIVNDLHQNYQYFETNIDKATKSLPDYVDYEVLFDKAEIKKGIPVLYQFLQKRAEDEQKELELARLKNFEHEKFNFDEAGIASSLVLERAMTESENYIAQRKKLNEDIAKINAEIAQEDTKYREGTKEYNRQMQISKETFESFKTDLENSTSTIQSNYIKKQQQQELDRQRNLERDFDQQTDMHKKIINKYQSDLDAIDKEMEEIRKTLQNSMMSEFSTYSGKVYDEAKKVVEERQKDKFDKIKQKVKELEEELYYKNKELEELRKLAENVTSQQDDYSEQNNYNENAEPQYNDQQENFNDNNQNNSNDYNEQYYNEQDNANNEQYYNEDNNVDNQNYQPEYDNNYAQDNQSSQDDSSWNYDYLNNSEQENNNQSYEEPETKPNSGLMSYSDYLMKEGLDKFNPNDNSQEDYSTQYSDEQPEDPLNVKPDYWGNDNSQYDNNSQYGENSQYNDNTQYDENQTYDNSQNGNYQNNNYQDDQQYYNESTDQQDESENIGENVEQNGEDEEENFDWLDKLISDSDNETENSQEENSPVETTNNQNNNIVRKKAGRPRKVVQVESLTPKRGRGRPRKEDSTSEEQDNAPAKKRGRPRKEDSAVKTTSVKKAGRPKKEAESSADSSKKRGRPKKQAETKQVTKSTGRGRPRKDSTEVKNSVGRPKKSSTTTTKKKAGRPKKLNINNVDDDVDLDAYLKVIDNAIAKENAKMKRTQKALATHANIKKSKK